MGSLHPSLSEKNEEILKTFSKKSKMDIFKNVQNQNSQKSFQNYRYFLFFLFFIGVFAKNPPFHIDFVKAKTRLFAILKRGSLYPPKAAFLCFEGEKRGKSVINF